MSTTTVKILQRAALAALLLVTAAACSNIQPAPQQVAAIEAQSNPPEGGD
jgi:hypothetical protein